MKHDINGSELVIHIDKDLLSTTVNECTEEIKPLLENDVGSVAIDLSSVSTVDSQGLNFLVGLYQESTRADRTFKVTGASPSLVRLFSFVKLNERFGISAS